MAFISFVNWLIPPFFDFFPPKQWHLKKRRTKLGEYVMAICSKDFWVRLLLKFKLRRVEFFDFLFHFLLKSDKLNQKFEGNGTVFNYF